MTRSLNRTLGFCIPTWNRERQLREGLAHLIVLAEPHGIPIYVSDNASDYDFDGLIAEARARYPHIVARRNPTNLGMGANFLRVVELAETRYAWLFSDDDRLVPDAVDRVLRLCESDRYDLIVPNREYRKPDMSRDAGRTASARTVPLELDDPGALLVEACVPHFTYIGCLVFRVDRWRGVEAGRYMPYPYFPHVSIVAEMMLPAGRALLLPDPLIHVRGGVFSWERKAVPVWFVHLQECLAVVPGYPRAVKRRALRRLWPEMAVYSVWLMSHHGVRRASIAAILSGRALGAHVALRAPFMWAAGTVAVLLGAMFPARLLDAARDLWRRLRKPA